MQQVELHAKLFREGDHLKSGRQDNRSISCFPPNSRIVSFQCIAVLMCKIVYKLLILRMEQCHDLSLAQNLKNPCNITETRYRCWRSSMPGGKYLDTGNQLFINFAQLINILDRSAHIDREIAIRSTSISFYLVFHASDSCRWRSCIGHIEDGGVTPGKPSPRAMRDIFFVFKPWFTQVTMHFNQARKDILATKIKSMLHIFGEIFIYARDFPVCNMDSPPHDTIRQNNRSYQR